MEFEFRRDITGQLQASFSMGHEAFASWLLDELARRPTVLSQVYREIERLQSGEGWEYQLEGEEYVLKLSRQEAEVRNARVDFDHEQEIEDSLGYYDDENQACCGLDDFKSMLDEWQRFSGM